jgi:hypothetical protein
MSSMNVPSAATTVPRPSAAPPTTSMRAPGIGAPATSSSVPARIASAT